MRKTILITGASSGLGRGMAREFAAMGRNLALCARRTDRLEELKQELESKHSGIKVGIFFGNFFIVRDPSCSSFKILFSPCLLAWMLNWLAILRFMPFSLVDTNSVATCSVRTSLPCQMN